MSPSPALRLQDQCPTQPPPLLTLTPTPNTDTRPNYPETSIVSLSPGPPLVIPCHRLRTISLTLTLILIPVLRVRSISISISTRLRFPLRRPRDRERMRRRSSVLCRLYPRLY